MIGRYGVIADRVEDFPALDMRELARAGVLAFGRHELPWVGAPEPLTVLAFPDALYIVGPSAYIAGIGVARTPCNLGGTRPWLICPGCGGRVAKLHRVGGRWR